MLDQPQSECPVVFLLNSLGLGGSESKTVRVVNELHRRGRNVHLLYLTPRDLIGSRVAVGVPVVCLNRTSKFSISVINRLRNYVISVGASTIVCINLYPLVYALPVRFLRGRKKLLVIAMTNTSDHKSKKIRRQMALYCRLLAMSDEVVFGCRAQLVEWTSLYRLGGVKRSVIYNGVDHDFFSPGRKATLQTADKVKNLLERIAEGDFLIGSVGNLRPEKNQRTLITAVAEIRDAVSHAKAVIIGEGVERANLELAISQQGLDERVFLPGRIEDVRPILERVDVFVLPSTAEIFSNAALEAMAMGKAVLLSDADGCREMVKHGSSGYLYDTADTRTIARMLVELAGDPLTRVALGTGARTAVKEKFTLSRMIEDYERLLFRT